MVDIFRCESIATSLSFSPNGDFLATAHVDNVGIFLWANRMQFTTVSLRSITEEDAIRVALPTSTTLEEESGEGKENEVPLSFFFFFFFEISVLVGLDPVFFTYRFFFPSFHLHR